MRVEKTLILESLLKAHLEFYMYYRPIEMFIDKKLTIGDFTATMTSINKILAVTSSIRKVSCRVRTDPHTFPHIFLISLIICFCFVLFFDR